MNMNMNPTRRVCFENCYTKEEKQTNKQQKKNKENTKPSKNSTLLSLIDNLAKLGHF